MIVLIAIVSFAFFFFTCLGEAKEMPTGLAAVGHLLSILMCTAMTTVFIAAAWLLLLKGPI